MQFVNVTEFHSGSRDCGSIVGNDLGLIGEDLAALRINQYLYPLDFVVECDRAGIVTKGFDPREVFKASAQTVKPIAYSAFASP